VRCFAALACFINRRVFFDKIYPKNISSFTKKVLLLIINTCTCTCTCNRRELPFTLESTVKDVGAGVGAVAILSVFEYTVKNAVVAGEIAIRQNGNG